MTAKNGATGSLIRSLELLWGGRGKPSRGPRPGLTLERIVRAGVDVADREGLAALSMRKVAVELGVGTMSLYRYVPGKSELLDLMVDHVYARERDGMAEHAGLGWRACLEFVAEKSWLLYTGSPWLLQVNQARPVLGPNSLAGLDFTLRALDGLELTGYEKVAVIQALDHFVLGAARTHVLQRQAVARTGLSDEEFWGAQRPYLERALDSGGYPATAALPEGAFTQGGEEAMRFGLRALLDGFQALVDGRTNGAGRAAPGSVNSRARTGS